MKYIQSPREIERKSFEIITRELEVELPDPQTAPIIKRVIHTTADFEYAKLIKIHPEAVEAAQKALQEGCRIYTDTNMVLSGINKRILKKYGGEVYCLVGDPEVAREAKERGVTRSMVAMEKAMADPETKLFVIGNAPTALFILCQGIQEGKAKPSAIIGVPVGFVGAQESKELLMEQTVPHITIQGRKGGSTVAVAIVNALLYMLE
ncbi:Precorrin-8X methylmutase CbiC/CobH [Alkaliphilus metalliredigens QYMF]|uniref:Precorrin-8X methylmutase CbiC/CobH n=1 Tax=Alkaliphilus metalliredigens (strain QYMF) TaxID=293826 RepID=A6TJE4_ALKMQ|nr:precorrin-8X methylmutase [Alkaliphilus metalliredigens]ABR46312.1 Precorrin-8X methylmutase CbiC/CobH [Alkaliphilus metalliredigens QYMF]